MRSSLNTFFNRVTPPDAAAGIDFRWHDVERHFRIDFPPDFKDLVSSFGSGIFLPSELELCNYLEMRKPEKNQFQSAFDQFLSNANDALRFTDAQGIKFLPETDGLLPFASFGRPYAHFLWDPSTRPWSIVTIREDGNIESHTNLATSDFLLRALDWRADFGEPSFRELVAQEPTCVESEFLPIPCYTPIDTSLFSITAAGMGYLSYNIDKRVHVSVAHSFALENAERERSDSVRLRWGWNPPEAPKPKYIASPATLDFVVRSSDGFLAYVERLANDLSSNRDFQRNDDSALACTQLQWESDGEISLVFLAQVEQHAWEVRLQVQRLYYEILVATAEYSVNSIVVGVP